MHGCHLLHPLPTAGKRPQGRVSSSLCACFARECVELASSASTTSPSHGSLMLRLATTTKETPEIQLYLPYQVSTPCKCLPFGRAGRCVAEAALPLLQDGVRAGPWGAKAARGPQGQLPQTPPRLRQRLAPPERAAAAGRLAGCRRVQLPCLHAFGGQANELHVHVWRVAAISLLRQPFCSVCEVLNASMQGPYPSLLGEIQHVHNQSYQLSFLRAAAAV